MPSPSPGKRQAERRRSVAGMLCSRDTEPPRLPKPTSCCAGRSARPTGRSLTPTRTASQVERKCLMRRALEHVRPGPHRGFSLVKNVNREGW